MRDDYPSKAWCKRKESPKPMTGKEALMAIAFAPVICFFLIPIVGYTIKYLPKAILWTCNAIWDAIMWSIHLWGL